MVKILKITHLRNMIQKKISGNLPFKQHNYEFEKCLENLENNEFKDVFDLPSFNVVDHYLSLDVDEVNVSNVIPLPDVDKFMDLQFVIFSLIQRKTICQVLF